MDEGVERVGFGEGSEVFGPVVAGEFVFGGLVESDSDIPVGCLVVDGYVVFGGESDGPGLVVDSSVDPSPL